MAVLKIYTDGACAGNQNEENIGGYGAVLKYGNHEKEIFGGQLNTTNNRMEMMALLEGLKAITKPNQTIEIYSDSAYLMDCFRQKWYVKWQQNNWKRAGNKPVENRDLWEALLPYLDNHDIKFFRVKGHLNLNHPSTDIDKHYKKFQEWNGKHYTLDEFKYVVEMNNRADKLANKGVDQFR